MGVGSHGKRVRSIVPPPSPQVILVSLMVFSMVWQYRNGISQGTFFQDSQTSLLDHPHGFHGNHPKPPQHAISLSELTTTTSINSQNNKNKNIGNRNLQNEEQAACEAKGFVYIHNIIQASNNINNSSSTSIRRIPKIVHQTSKSRCLTKLFARVTESWRSLDGYEYYLHDDTAMMQLLVSQSDEFPMLHDLVHANCLPHGTLKADIWRYLVLWKYGGIYADLDTQPTILFNTTNPIIQDSDDGWFVVEQFHILSQYVMAMSPYHPLMYYALYHATLKILAQVDTHRINAALVTGPHALHYALQDFCHDAGIVVERQGTGYKPVKAGWYQGTHGRSITVVGRGEYEGEYMTREMMSLPLKKKQYAKMNMSSFHDDKLQVSGQSCLSAMYQYHHHAMKKKKLGES